MRTKKKMATRATVCFLVWASGTGAPRIEIVLENASGGRGVELLFPRPPVLLAQGQPALRFLARQPLVLQHDRQPRARAELPGEALHLRRHVVRRSVEPQRQADDELGDTVLFTGQPGDLLGR